MGRPPKPFEHFYVTVPESGCWLWLGTWDKDGYGKYARTANRAHRESYERNVGPIPAGMMVCHRCDTPPCVNPSHLFLGTHADNMGDRRARGRAAKKFTAAEILSALSSAETTRAAAKRLGINHSYVWKLRQGNYRKDVER